MHVSPAPRVRFGVDVLVDEPSYLSGARRVGLVTNDAARLARDTSLRSRVALLGAGVKLVRLFGPEHGLHAGAADGAPVLDGVDDLTSLPIVSLYGERMHPSLASLSDLDVVLFDIPDVGARFYTYTWTLYHVLAACEAADVPLVVLDRPNPHGGDLSEAEGPMLDLACTSFLGESDIPLRHQLTLGELARLWQRERFTRAKLHVVACDGWSRDMRWGDVGVPWVPTSPSMPSWASAALYPGTCLFEATNLSVARGTDAPFQMIGAPWLDSRAIVQQVLQRSDGLVQCTATTFTPAMDPYAHRPCAGVSHSLADRTRCGPVAAGLLMLATVMHVHHEQFAWTHYPTAANPSGNAHFTRLTGRSDLQPQLEAYASSVDLTRALEWSTPDGWMTRVADVLLYASARDTMA